MTSAAYSELDLMAPPLRIGIPLLSRRIAKDWAKIEGLLSRTLVSILNQTDQDFEVVIVCHEPPDVPEMADPRITVHSVDFDIPYFTWEMELDRLRKLEVIGSLHRERGAGTLLLVDGDDLIASTLVADIKAARTKAVLIGTGYRFNYTSKRLIKLPRFWKRCGSCAAVTWTEAEIAAVPFTDRHSVFHQFVDTRHHAWDRFIASRGWSCRLLSKPSAMYVVNHGQNESDVLANATWKWRLYEKFSRATPLTPDLAKAFSLQP